MKLWEKNIAVDAVVERLTVGDDRVLDVGLYRHDCVASAAHAKVLARAGILTVTEANELATALRGAFESPIEVIPPEFEDVHSYLESALVSQIGDTGKKVHTGRSRNDQVMVATRLMIREATVQQLTQLLEIASALCARFEQNGSMVMPGYTHLQRAMPTTVGAWLHAFLEGSLECIRDGLHLLKALNTNPLGAAAGFGTGLGLDRECSAELLGFSRAQRSFIDIQNSRGRYEERYLTWAQSISAVFEKFAWDLSLYTTKEFGFVTIPDAYTTGSSIMPQKKNPDLVELLRARCGLSRGITSKLQWSIGKLPSNYHRDLQLSKAPFIEGAQNLAMILESVALLVPALEFNEDKINAAMSGELFATFEAYRAVRSGVPFRDAYRQTADRALSGDFQPTDYGTEIEQLKEETRRYFMQSAEELSALNNDVRAWETVLAKVPEQVFSRLQAGQ